MKYVVDIAGRAIEVDIDGARLRVDGQEVSGSLTELAGTPVAVLSLGSRVHRVEITRGAARGQYSLELDGWRYDVEALDERSRAIRELSAAAAAHSGPAPLVAPMPGLIVRISVVPGDPVQAGQGLVVMEAMKMENELRAPAAGVVKAVLVEPGTAVERGATLVELA